MDLSSVKGALEPNVNESDDIIVHNWVYKQKDVMAWC
jgi:hypothetical protein